MTQSWSKRVLRRRLIAGLIVIAPVTATLYVLWWIFQLLDSVLGRFLYPALSRYIPWIELLPGLGLIVLLGLLVLVGWTAEWAVGRRALAWWHELLERIPVTRRIYGAANSIVRTILSQESRPFTAVVMVEYPSAGRWSIGFLAADAPGAVRSHLEDAVSVFVPTTPNPTSGWIVVVPRAMAIPIAMTVDQAFAYILSAGAVRPDERTAPRAAPVLVASGTAGSGGDSAPGAATRR